MRPSSRPISTPAPKLTEPPWKPVSSPPEPYEIVDLLFDSGKVGHGTWNGKLWWGYDERVRHSAALHPVAWRPAPSERTQSSKRAHAAEPEEPQ
jgi:hypothetical protein